MKKPDWMSKGRDFIREKVRERDGYRCQSLGCNKGWNPTMRRLDVHHLNGKCGKKSRGYDRLEDMDGLITYCHKCHMSKHAHKRRGESPNLKQHLPEIKEMLRTKSYDAVAKAYGVSQSAVWVMVNRIEG